MSSGGSPAGGPVDLRKDRPGETRPVPGETRPGPAWIVLPARVIALIVIVPLRLVHDLAVQAARGLRAVWDRMLRAPRRLGRALYRWLLAPIGRLIAAVARGTGALLGLLIVRPLRWLAVVVVLGFLRWVGRGAAHLGRWVYRAILVPIGVFLALVGRGLVWLGVHALLRPLQALGRGLAWLGERALWRPLCALGRGLAWLAFQAVLRPLKALGRGLLWLLGVIERAGALLLRALVIIPAAFVWRHLLLPPLRGLLWLARGSWYGLVRAWNFAGLMLAWLARVLLVLPAKAVWRYVLAPIIGGIKAVWRTAGRFLRWAWRTLVAVPARVLVVAPARWAWTSVLRPAGRSVREAWRVSVRDPLRAARRTVRETSRDVRLQLRRTFRGG
ncbi:hypothetical protein ACN3XK_04160 [Actinomadura welshii]